MIKDENDFYEVIAKFKDITVRINFENRPTIEEIKEGIEYELMNRSLENEYKIKIKDYKLFADGWLVELNVRSFLLFSNLGRC